MREKNKIEYNDKDNEALIRKYDGYMRIYKKKQEGNSGNKQYFESPLVKEIVKNKGIQFNADMVEKVVKTWKIKDEYGTNFNNIFD